MAVKRVFKSGPTLSSEKLKGKTSRKLGKDVARLREEHADTGRSGQRQRMDAEGKEVDAFLQDNRLIDEYGRNAPKSRGFMTRRGNKKGGSIKKFKLGEIIERPKVVPPNDPSLKEEPPKRVLRPKKRPEGVVVPPVDKEGGSGSYDEVKPQKRRGSYDEVKPQKRRGAYDEVKPQKRRGTPGSYDEETHKRTDRGGRPHNAEQVARPERERGGTLDDRKPMQLAPIGMKHGGMAKKGGKSKVRGAGIARKGVRPAKMR